MKEKAVEVLSVSPESVRLRVDGNEHLLAFRDHPWFLDAKVAELFNVTMSHEYHLQWPDLDVDLHVDSLEDPQRFPLKS